MRILPLTESLLPELQRRADAKRGRLNWLVQGACYVPRFRSTMSTSDLLATTQMEPLGDATRSEVARARPATAAVTGWVGETLVASRAAVRVPMTARGTALAGAQLVEVPLADLGPTQGQLLMLGQHLLESLRGGAVRWVVGTPGPQWPESLLLALGFVPLVEAAERTFPLGLSGLGTVVGKFGPHPLRRLATAARGLRNKLLDVDMNGGQLEVAQQMAAEYTREDSLAVARTPAYLGWRYRDAPGRSYRMLALRRQAGAGIDAWAIVEPFALDRGRFGVRILEHWTRAREVTAVTWLLGELAMWALAEQASQLRAVAASGTPRDLQLLAVGAVQKTATLPLYWRSLADGEPPPDPSRVAIQAGDFMSF